MSRSRRTEEVYRLRRTASPGVPWSHVHNLARPMGAPFLFWAGLCAGLALCASLKRANRQGEAEYGAAARRVFHPDPPGMILDNPLAYRQADPHAVFLGRIERLENPFSDFARQAGS